MNPGVPAAIVSGFPSGGRKGVRNLYASKRHKRFLTPFSLTFFSPAPPPVAARRRTSRRFCPGISRPSAAQPWPRSPPRQGPPFTTLPNRASAADRRPSPPHLIPIRPPVPFQAPSSTHGFDECLLGRYRKFLLRRNLHQVERRRVELPTSALRTQRSPN